MSEPTLYDWMNRQKAEAEVAASESGMGTDAAAALIRAKIWSHLLYFVKESAELTFLQRKFVLERVEDAVAEGSHLRDYRRSAADIMILINTAQ